MQSINVILADLPGLGRVRLCDCDSVHVNVGPVTLNLEPAAFEQMAALIASAKERLTQIRELGNDEAGTVGMSQLRRQMTH
jgi:hypothetical protein